MRHFSEQEIGAILKRTAELSKQADRGVQDGLVAWRRSSSSRLTPGWIRTLLPAQRPRSRRPLRQSPKADLFGGPLAYSTDVDLDIDVDEEAWESMLPAIRNTFHDPGTVSVRDGTFEWTGTGGEGNKKAHVHIRKTPSGTRLHVFWSQLPMAIPFFIPTLMALFVSLPIVFEELHLGFAGIPVVALVVAAMFMLSRFGVTTMRKRYIGKIDRLSKDLSMIAYEHAAADKDASADKEIAADGGATAVETGTGTRIPDLDSVIESEPDETSEPDVALKDRARLRRG